MRLTIITALLALTFASCSVMKFLPARIGEGFYERGDYANAITFYMKAIATDDQRAETFYWLGMSLYKHGDLEEAMLAFEKSIEKDSTDVVVLDRLAAVNLDLGHLDRAATYCNRAINLYDGYLECYNTLGHVLFEQGQLDSAAQCFRYVLITAEALRWQSIAERSFVSFNEEKAEANNGLGEVCIARGLLPQALDCFTAASSLAHHWETPWFNKGRAYEALGNTKAAEVAYQRTIDIAPTNTLAYKNLARMYRRMGRDTDAVRAFSGALLADSLDAECYYGLAQIYEERGDNWRAAEVYARAVEKGPDNPNTYLGAARTSMALGNYQDAIDYLSALVDLQPEKAEPHNALGEAYRAAGDTTAALLSFEEAATVDTLYAIPLRNSGSLLLKLGKETQGIDYYIRAARLGDAPAADFLRLRGIRWE
jgi:protein O-GlcNAc transferase